MDLQVGVKGPGIKRIKNHEQAKQDLQSAVEKRIEPGVRTKSVLYAQTREIIEPALLCSGLDPETTEEILYKAQAAYVKKYPELFFD